MTPHIIWKGCSRKPYEPSDKPLPPEAVKLEVPQNDFWIRALFMAAPLFLPVIASLYLKSYITGHTLIDKQWIAIGLLTALALSIVHEWLHCLPYPRTATAYIGILPWMAFLFCPITQKELVSFCWGLAIMGVTSPCPDYLHAYYIWKHVPKHAFIQTTSHGTYWFQKTSRH